MLTARVITPFLTLVMCIGAAAQEESSLTSNKEIASYAIGTQIGTQVLQSLQSQPLPLDHEALLIAIGDILRGDGPRFDLPTLQAAVTAFQQEAEKMRQQIAEDNLKRAMDFLVSNRDQEGVVETESGLQYKIIESGEGSNPAPEDLVVVHYRGRLLDDTEFDSSYTRGQPAEFYVNQVIRGWQEVLQLMKPGDRWEVYISPDLGYGPNGAGGSIGPNELLVFEVALLEIKPAQGSTE